MIAILLIALLSALFSIYASFSFDLMMQSAYASPECIKYDSHDNTIVISCGNASLTDVYNALNASKPGILNRGPDKLWTLNANIKVENNTNFYINSTDTSWLKINSTFSGVADKEPNHIVARGNMIIDSVKITSWDTTKNDYARANGTIPRSYILVNYGNGTTNITNSELAYLGYPHARSFGLTYYTGAGSIIKNNKIHDLQTGFYSDGFAHGAYNITIEGNDFYNNTLYGIDPHSGTHDMIIRNNTAHDNGRQGIICSTDCYNIIINSNRVFNNTSDGIVLHNNTTNSIISNNIVYDNKEDQIWLRKLANNNSVFANNINGGLNGIRVSEGSANNKISNNTIANSYLAGIRIENDTFNNHLALNKLRNAILIAYENDTDIKNETHLGNPILKIKTIFKGLDWPTSMAFLGPDDILVLEKNTGKVKRIVNGVMSEQPLLDVNVANKAERGMLGIAIAKHQEENNKTTYVFLYFTEAPTKDGDDVKENKVPLGNRLYRYELVENKLVNSKLLLDLPLVPTGFHNGGKIAIGPDNNIYIVVGDVQGHHSKSQNYLNGTEPDGRGGILRITQDGNPVGKGILGHSYPLNLYYAYGILNSFGIGFDPLTGNLWDTENGPAYGDEINLVKPGFNSGWVKVQGLWEPDYSNKTKSGFTIGKINPNPENLVDFNGKGKYSTPEFTFENTVGPTAIKFFNSDKLGPKYQNDIFVANVHTDYLLHFDLSETRNELLLEGALTDKIANNPEELAESGVIFGKGLGGVTDIAVGPDGYLYLLRVWQGAIQRVVDVSNNNDPR